MPLRPRRHIPDDSLRVQEIYQKLLGKGKSQTDALRLAKKFTEVEKLKAMFPLSSKESLPLANHRIISNHFKERLSLVLSKLAGRNVLASDREIRAALYAASTYLPKQYGSIFDPRFFEDFLSKYLKQRISETPVAVSEVDLNKINGIAHSVVETITKKKIPKLSNNEFKAEMAMGFGRKIDVLESTMPYINPILRALNELKANDPISQRKIIDTFLHMQLNRNIANDLSI